MERIRNQAFAGPGATARALATAVHRRRFRLPSGDMLHALLLHGGRGRIVEDGGGRPLELEGPAASVVAMGSRTLLELEPGASGRLVGISGDVLLQAIGGHPDAVHLRYMITSTLAVAVVRGEGRWATLAAAFDGIARELEKAEQGAPAMLAAYASIVLVSLWRLSGAAPGGAGGVADASAVMQRFRQLVETRFREHWRIRRYADALGVTHDRLHAICRRTAGKPPLRLVHERLVYEGLLLLERSDFSVQQIAHALGFNDPTHFSHFFKKKTGASPKAYRARAGGRSGRPSGAEGASFADWP